ncbi:hypothetical protein [Streptomyces sp. NPDC003697]
MKAPVVQAFGTARAIEERPGDGVTHKVPFGRTGTVLGSGPGR